MGKKILDGIKRINDSMRGVNQQEVRAQRARFLNEEVFDMYRLKLQRCKDCNSIFDLDSRTECRCGNRNGTDLFQ